ncbi:phosphate ABC transporter permease subunit PstC [Roseovarius sp. TE539]|uniref:phosphate ABC transporter permease subunit PstC n=1 Tax=Roseovarius sp. TE539 TaxID=2249812 RepID=UPI000DDC8592|nr:phosphate ABC transporter permease subunit PstC [Roseovarius sp. TE539]RBI70830.1 phosphate ABC transporter permease subunit PstC [Roseovarius sp. TE539]
MVFTLFALVLVLAAAAYLASRNRAARVDAAGDAALHSRPSYHGLHSALWVLMAGLGVLVISTIGATWFITSTLMNEIAQARPDAPLIEHQLILSDARAIADGRISSGSDMLREQVADRFAGLDRIRNVVVIVLTLGAAILGGVLSYLSISPEWRARNRSETVIRAGLLVMAVIAILTTIGIVLSLIFETVRFFNAIDWQLHKFIFGTTWSPLSGVFEGKMDAEKVGALPLFAGTLLITLIAMLVAVPVGLFAAIFLSDFASKTVRSYAKPMLEILAGIPTVVYGFFAAITVAPFLRDTGEAIGIRVASESALAAGIVMGIMIIPFISSLSDDVINSVPQSLRDGSLGLGATKAETIRQVVLPAALPGIVSAVLLAISRAIGETMIVVMAAGQGANLTANPLEAVTTVTVQIVALITGDTEASTAAGPAFTLGFTLFVLTLLMNMAAQRLVARYRERYD